MLLVWVQVGSAAELSTGFQPPRLLIPLIMAMTYNRCRALRLGFWRKPCSSTVRRYRSSCCFAVCIFDLSCCSALLPCD